MNLLLQYPKIVFFTGAGMSKESGMPTYRGEGGMWTQYRYQDYACQEAFERDPAAVWEFHEVRRATAAACQPHQGHDLLAQLVKQRLAGGRGGVTIITQNIDGMHQRAGVADVYELHGSLWRVRCDHCGVTYENTELPVSNYRHSCGHYLRPAITWFGDPLDRSLLTKAVDAISKCNLFVSIGTSGQSIRPPDCPCTRWKMAPPSSRSIPRPPPSLGNIKNTCAARPPRCWPNCCSSRRGLARGPSLC